MSPGQRLFDPVNGDYGQLESAIHSLPPPYLCKPRELCPTRSCMDLQVKHISGVLLLMGSSTEQLALLQGSYCFWPLQPKACTEQRERLET